MPLGLTYNVVYFTQAEKFFFTSTAMIHWHPSDNLRLVEKFSCLSGYLFMNYDKLFRAEYGHRV